MKLSKSKLALAKVINENGGWRDSSDWAAQDGDDLRVSFYFGSKPTRETGCDYFSHSKTGKPAGREKMIRCTELLKNWHQTVLSREEYYQAYPKADADEWIEWSGVAKSPVGKGVAVDVKMKDGTQHFGQLIDDECWGGYWGDASIIAYRLHKPEVKPDFCESVMRSIPEPESIDGLCAKVTEENKHQHVDAKPTIEQLAQDYRNKLDFAKRKQQEADDAKAASDAALRELERAGEALGLLIGIAKPATEPELVITDWRDLKVGDEVEYVSGGLSHLVGRIGIVTGFDKFSRDQNVKLSFDSYTSSDTGWPAKWKFIRRP